MNRCTILHKDNKIYQKEPSAHKKIWATLTGNPNITLYYF